MDNLLRFSFSTQNASPSNSDSIRRDAIADFGQARRAAKRARSAPLELDSSVANLSAIAPRTIKRVDRSSRRYNLEPRVKAEDLHALLDTKGKNFQLPGLLPELNSRIIGHLFDLELADFKRVNLRAIPTILDIYTNIDDQLAPDDQPERNSFAGKMSEQNILEGIVSERRERMNDWKTARKIFDNLAPKAINTNSPGSDYKKLLDLTMNIASSIELYNDEDDFGGGTGKLNSEEYQTSTHFLNLLSEHTPQTMDWEMVHSLIEGLKNISDIPSRSSSEPAGVLNFEGPAALEKIIDKLPAFPKKPSDKDCATFSKICESSMNYETYNHDILERENTINKLISKCIEFSDEPSLDNHRSPQAIAHEILRNTFTASLPHLQQNLALAHSVAAQLIETMPSSDFTNALAQMVEIEKIML